MDDVLIASFTNTNRLANFECILQRQVDKGKQQLVDAILLVCLQTDTPLDVFIDASDIGNNVLQVMQTNRKYKFKEIPIFVHDLPHTGIRTTNRQNISTPYIPIL